jgi:hypothetical protein
MPLTPAAPSSNVAALSAGVGHVDRKEYARAERAFFDAEELFRSERGPTDPKVVSAIARRAWCLVMLDQFDQGIALYREALKLKEERGDAKEPTAQKLRDHLTDAKRRAARRTPGRRLACRFAPGW